MHLGITYKDYNTAIKAAQLFELRKQVGVSVMSGKFKDARAAQIAYAKEAVENADIAKTLPKITITNIPFVEWCVLALRSLEYKIYKAFTRKTPAEKQFAKMFKA